METDGPKNPGEDQVDASTNVVQLPRDWFGPRDELVPIGEPERDAPARADDFWGEGSAAVQDAMRRPEVEPPPMAGAESRRPAQTLLPDFSMPKWISKVWLRRRVVLGIAATCLLALAIIGSMWPPGLRLPQSGRSEATLSPAVIGTVAPSIVFRGTGSRGTREHAERRRAARHSVASHARARARSDRRGAAGAGAVRVPAEAAPARQARARAISRCPLDRPRARRPCQPPIPRAPRLR